MSRPGIVYQPALDGLRALAVLVVLLFHGEVTGFSGGYLGVSVFFTLSGYLITSLLIAEHAGSGRVAVGAFYVRRAKRLLPASLLCLTAIAVAASTTDWFTGVATLRRDLLGALFQVANWVSLAGGGSYQELFADAAGQSSPVEHYWSLAIEEQFYWLWPVAFLALCRTARSHRSRTAVLAVVTVLFSLTAPLIAWLSGPDAAYWATPARAGEILAGAVIAFVLTGRRPGAAWSWVGAASFVALSAAVVLFPAAHGPAYEGALPLVGVASALLIVGLQTPGPLVSVLSTGPLVWLGRISYGVYLFHWPVFIVLDPRRVEVSAPALFAIRVGVTLILAQLSFVLVERPIRAGITWRPPAVAITAAATCAVAAIVTVVLVPASDAEYWQVAGAVEAAGIEPVGTATLAPLVTATTVLPASTSPASTSPVPSSAAPVSTAPPSSTTSTVAPLPVLSRPIRVVVAGDSTAEATGFGLAQWASERPDLAQVSLHAEKGCGFLRGGEQLVNEWEPVPQRCAEWLDERLPAAVGKLRPDVVMLMTTSWDVLDRRWDGGEQQNPYAADYRARLEADFGAVTDSLLSAGAGQVVWVREPVPNVFWWGSGQTQEDPGRHAVLYAIMDRIATELPGRVTVIDLPAWLDQHGLTLDHDVRPDGVHWSADASARIAREFLGEQLVRAALATQATQGS